ncbi:MAG: hypothetical protein AAF391_03800 [Bacteroidota bacterium]
MKIDITQKKVALSTLAVYLTTSIHHVYGAWLYDTPWRNHIAYQGFTWLVISYVILLAYVKWRYKIIAWLFVVFAGFFFVGAIGFYEGFYNHVLKNILYFIGVNGEFLHTMYPPPKYELPNDLLFEITGVLTFGVCLWCLKTMIRLLKS